MGRERHNRSRWLVLQSFAQRLGIIFADTFHGLRLALRNYCRLEHTSESDKGRNDKYLLRANTGKLYRTVVCIAFPPRNAPIPPGCFRSRVRGGSTHLRYRFWDLAALSIGFICGHDGGNDPIAYLGIDGKKDS
jgi:hypothetical protein